MNKRLYISLIEAANSESVLYYSLIRSMAAFYLPGTT